MKKFIINAILENSILDEMEIVSGDILLSINKTPVNDVFDYRYLIADETLLLEIEKSNGEIWELEIEKDFEEDLGVLFPEEMITTKICKNNCIFCFVDQLPKGMRESLYVKDDDERLSFLAGNYITMTNLTQYELDRIVRYRIMPMNLSIHTTNPELRCKMLKNRFAGDVMDYLNVFKENHIQMNGQIVLVPNYNDREELKKTLHDLMQFYPVLQSVSVVPVGLSKYREGLEALESFDAVRAKETLDIIGEFHTMMVEKFGEGFAYPSDEFFLLANLPIPEPAYYNGFPQIENGVGMLADFKSDFYNALATLDLESVSEKKLDRIGIVTGIAAFSFINQLICDLKKAIPQIDVVIYPIKNTFFGENINISGLLTGEDIHLQLKEHLEKNPRDLVLIPENALRSGTTVFLDDCTLESLSNALQTNINSVPVNGESLIHKLISEEK